MGHDFIARTSRRSFLRGAAFTATSAALATRTGFASQERGRDAAPPAEPGPDDPSPIPPAHERPDQQKDTPDHSTDGEKKPSTVVLKDDQGLEYRECPQCGFNMYRQDRTWTCENCGYSYVE